MPQSRAVSGILFRGDRSDTSVNWQFSEFRGIPLRGDRSETSEALQFRFVRRIPFNGDRSASFRFPNSLPLQDRLVNSASARTGEMSVTLTVRNCRPVTIPF